MKTIRKATMEDLREIEAIFAYAREFMKRNGNPNQWKDDRPWTSTIKTDIRNGNFYLIEEAEEIVGCFSFIRGEDPTYLLIEEGQWLNDRPYAAIHRVAGNGRSGGLLEAALAFCLPQCSEIRMDTHEDNRIMRHLLEKNGFVYCGTIYTEDGTARRAYHLSR